MGERVQEALEALRGTVTARYSAAVSARWKASNEEYAAEKEMKRNLQEHGKAIRRYVRQRLQLRRLKMHCDFYGPEWSVNHSVKPVVLGAYVCGSIYLFEALERGSVTVGFSLSPRSVEELDKALDGLRALLESYRAAAGVPVKTK